MRRINLFSRSCQLNRHVHTNFIDTEITVITPCCSRSGLRNVLDIENIIKIQFYRKVTTFLEIRFPLSERSTTKIQLIKNKQFSEREVKSYELGEQVTKYLYSKTILHYFLKLFYKK
jgi:hypothetical protein